MSVAKMTIGTNSIKRRGIRRPKDRRPVEGVLGGLIATELV